MSGLKVVDIDLEFAVVGDHRLVAQNNAVLDSGAAPDVTLAANDRAPYDRFLPDRRVCPQDRLIDDGLFFDVALVANNASGRGAAAGFDDRPVIDEAGRLDNRPVFDAGIRRHPGRTRGLVEGICQITSVTDVAVHLHVLLRRADIDPITPVYVGDERLAALDQRGKEAALDRPGSVFRNSIERLWLEHVDSRVDRVAGDLVRFRLFEKTLDVAAVVGLDEAVRRWVVDWSQNDRGFRAPLAMKGNDGGEVHLRQHVSVEDDDRLGERFPRVAHRPRGAGGLGLHDILNRQTSPAAVAEDFLDAPRLVIQTEDDLIDFRDLLQKVELVMQKWAIEDRNDRFWCVNCQRAQSRALAPSQEYRLHSQPSMLSLSRSFVPMAP